MARVPPCLGGSQGFDSPAERQTFWFLAAIAQTVERCAEHAGGGGSIPSRSTRFNGGLGEWSKPAALKAATPDGVREFESMHPPPPSNRRASDSMDGCNCSAASGLYRSFSVRSGISQNITEKRFLRTKLNGRALAYEVRGWEFESPGAHQSNCQS